MIFDGEYGSRVLQNELKSPVSGILSLAQLLMLEPPGTPELHELAQAIYDRGQKLLILMDNLQDLDRIQRGVFQLEREPLIINNLLDQIVHDYERALKLKGVSARLRVQGLPLGSAPLMTLWAKENLLWGILDNAFRNAYEASPSGGTLELGVSLEGDLINIILENEGEVPFDIREEFFQAWRSSKPQGLGLGTFVIRSFTMALEGEVDMQTGAGRTTLRVSLPQREGKLSL
ncbi:MAG: HAMP domain-containing histidine kinase [Spirochaetales bacterium]|nr:HAMP domain-containing histidine kinase [Spirochaetales bacterium]